MVERSEPARRNDSVAMSWESPDVDRFEPETEETPRPRWGYWVLVVALFVFGALSILTIGAAFLLMAVTLLVLAPFRDRVRVFWPVLLLVGGFIAGYALIAPWTCSSETTTDLVEGTTVTTSGCWSAVGIRYDADPSPVPGLLAGAGLGAVAAGAAVVVVRRQEH